MNLALTASPLIASGPIDREEKSTEQGDTCRVGKTDDIAEPVVSKNPNAGYAASR